MNVRSVVLDGEAGAGLGGPMDVPWPLHCEGLSADCWGLQTKEQLWPRPLGSKTCFYSVPVPHFPSDIHFKRLSGFFMLPPLGLSRHSPPSLQHPRRSPCWIWCCVSPRGKCSRAFSRPGCQTA